MAVFAVHLGTVCYGGPDTIYVVAASKQKAIEYCVAFDEGFAQLENDGVYAVEIDTCTYGIFGVHGSDY